MDLDFLPFDFNFLPFDLDFLTFPFDFDLDLETIYSFEWKWCSATTNIRSIIHDCSPRPNPFHSIYVK